MSQINIAFALIGGLTLVLGLMTGWAHLRLRWISEPMLALALGVAAGPVGLDLLRPHEWGAGHAALREVARLALGISVMAAALSLRPGTVRDHWRSLAVLLGPVMVGMWAASAALTWALLPVAPLVALLIGAALTPTDPVLASTIVTGPAALRHVPRPVRHALSAEAGANDGLGYLFVMLPVLLLTHPTEAWSDWLVDILLWEVAGAVVLGTAIGWAAGCVERWARDRDYIEHASLLTIALALSVTTLGLVRLIGSDGILAVFTAGLAYQHNAAREDERQERDVQESISRLAVFPVFVMFGGLLPWQEWQALGWAAWVLPPAVLLLRRPPVLLGLGRFIPMLERARDRRFAAWFGPIGVAALFYALHVQHETGRPAVWHVVSLVVFASVLVHGATATPLTQRYPEQEPDADESPAD